MQRMLVGLLVFLTAVVGVLAVMLFQLQDEVDAQSRSRPSSSSRTPAPEGADPEMVAKLDRRVSALLRQIDELRAQHRETVRAIARAAPAAKPKGSDDTRIPSAREELARATRRAGDIAVTEQDEAFYIAVKNSVDRKTRIKGLFDTTMRRFDRLAANGTFLAVEGEDRKKVEAAILKYVTATDSMLTRYYRKPNEQIKALPLDQRREGSKAERETINAQAQTDLAVVLGPDQAQIVADKMLKGVRRIRPGGKNNRRRRDR